MQRVGGGVEPLPPREENALGIALQGPARGEFDHPPRIIERVLHAARHALAVLREHGQEFIAIRREQFRRCAWCGRAEVRGEVGDGEIYLMPHGIDDGNTARENGAGDDLFVEAP